MLIISKYLQKHRFDQKESNLIKYKSLLSHIKMNKEILIFGDVEIEKRNYHHKSSIFLKVVNTENVLVSNKISSGVKSYKDFFGYLHNNHKVKPLHMLLKTRPYIHN